MSLLTASILLTVELVIAVALVFFSKDERKTRRALMLMTIVMSAIGLGLTFGFAGTSEANNTSPSTGDWTALAFGAINGGLFIRASVARERKYGSTPTSNRK